MKRINRYIMRQVISVTVFATVVLCIAVMLVQSVRLIDLIVNRGLPITEFAYMASLMVPRFVALVMPIAMFGAMLFTYNRMINDSELVVMRSAGMSTASLAKPGLIAAVLGSVVCLGMTLYTMPKAAQEMRFHVEKNRSQWGAALLHEGRFTTVDSSITLFVKEREGSELFGILYHNQEDPEAPYTIMAERGAVVETESGPRILVVRGSRQTFQDGRLHLVEFDRTVIDIGGPAKGPGPGWQQPEERLLPDLFNPDMDNTNDKYYADKLIAEGHNRLATALLPIAYSVAALAFVLRGGYSRQGNVFSLIGAVAAMILILVGHMSVVSAAGNDLRLWPAIYLNALVPTVVGLFFVLRPRKHRRRSAETGALAAAE
ncbi:MAG: LptF/LptG family permease [Alphaproteobacteria bacterium]|nr:LptF/LptG family permease [Alphaproteobacteria bacterium]MEC9266555.1 LptF/LptG family permease [Pseudomonadota bacterium]